MKQSISIEKLRTGTFTEAVIKHLHDNNDVCLSFYKEITKSRYAKFKPKTLNFFLTVDTVGKNIKTSIGNMNDFYLDDECLNLRNIPDSVFHDLMNNGKGQRISDIIDLSPLDLEAKIIEKPKSYNSGLITLKHSVVRKNWSDMDKYFL